MIKLFTTNLLLVFLVLSSYGQDPSNYINTNLISASPNAEGAGGVPVTLYTGTAHFSVPIYQYSGNNLGLSVGLSYGYTGFKPAREASLVGLGWTLQAGGVITRSVRDKVDGSLTSGNNFEDWSATGLPGGANGELQDHLKDMTDPDNASDWIDGEPDVYNYSFPGGSGKFIIVNSVFKTFPSSGLSFSGNPSSGFTIKTESGIIYTFNVLEHTTIGQSSSDTYQIPTYASSFHLSSITHPAGEVITFIYDNEGTIEQPYSQTQTYHGSLYGPKQVYPTEIDNVRRLSEIQTTRGTIVFDEGSSRDDIDGPLKTLDQVRILDNDDVEIRKIEYNYGYFSSSESGDLDKKKYLKLEEVVINDQTQGPQGNQTYSFSYNNETGSTFPLSTTKGVDHFGYYNGEDTNDNLIPEEYISVSDTTTMNGDTGAADRTPNLAYAVYGALNEITYPSGGKTAITYEMNQVASESLITSSTFAATDIVRDPNGPDVQSSAPIYFDLTHGQSVFLNFIGWSNLGINVEYDVEIFEYDPIGETIGSPVYQIKLGKDAEGDTVALSAGNYAYTLTLDQNDDNTFFDVVISYVEGYHARIVGPGVRVDSITTYPLIGIPITKQYTYVDDAGGSTGETL
ncbi:MAG: hypothetical protein GY816_01085, partial [Cytophagales bacterium]|nr:hypothetical protein [Cytophagales bacterium]